MLVRIADKRQFETFYELEIQRQAIFELQSLYETFEKGDLESYDTAAPQDSQIVSALAFPRISSWYFGIVLRHRKVLLHLLGHQEIELLMPYTTKSSIRSSFPETWGRVGCLPVGGI